MIGDPSGRDKTPSKTARSRPTAPATTEGTVHTDPKTALGEIRPGFRRAGSHVATAGAVTAAPR